MGAAATAGVESGNRDAGVSVGNVASLDREYNCVMPESEITFNVYGSHEGGYVAKKADGGIIVHANTMDLLKVKIKDAVRGGAGEPGTLPAIRLVNASSKGRWIGSAKGEFVVPDDFNDPLPKEIVDLFR
jgi:hypothetical protein